jgi:hypothetical protein
MGPGLAYFAIPVFVVVATVPSILINWLFDLANVRRVALRQHWFALGSAYSLFGASYALAVTGMNGTLSLFVGGALAIGAAWAIRTRWGVVAHAIA